MRTAFAALLMLSATVAGCSASLPDRTAQHVLPPTQAATRSPKPSPLPPTPVPTTSIPDIAVPLGILPRTLPVHGLVVERENTGALAVLQPQASGADYVLPAHIAMMRNLTYMPLLVSPDSTRLAYMRYTEKGVPVSLETVTASGDTQVLTNWPAELSSAIPWWEPIEWYDHDLISVARSSDQGQVYVFSARDGAYQALPPPFPVENTNGKVGMAVGELQPGAPSYAPGADRVVVGRYAPLANPAATYEMWNASTGRLLWERSACVYYGRPPQWSPDGTMAAIVLPPDLSCPGFGEQPDNLYVVHRNGREVLLAEGFTGQATWSPDGTMIAGFLAGRGGAVAVLHVGARSMTIYELPESTHYLSPTQLIVWSPDGRYLALNQIIDEDGFEHRIIVLDLQQQDAYILMDDAYAHAWLAP